MEHMADARKPQWMTDHEASDQRSFDSLSDTLARIEAKIDPMYDNYMAASRIGKWLMGLAVFGSILLGIVLSAKQLWVK